ncbi:MULTISPECIES: SDR family oxidoreductase [Myxococcus]|uniref:SDR family oxidoreductase n=1 Tax=Myxococcus xanthus TaxID=34 RepID=A0A7Y4JJ39_MYXXA|nr:MULTISPECIES: SDR family oxidoreductase [Myxococcus]NOJ78062.1 SDR family oxidoreductase [Myxococcus xanthus]NOJ84491.1 SDR family oxidoreductase [Myxococcus xanthus]NOK05974.1 SDR family oxidoreductase [Myxococcus xanthus]
MSNIQGKVVVITGASSGLGEETARHLASRGAKVFLGARRTDRLAAVVADIERGGGQASARAVDVTKRAEVTAFIQAAVDRFGRIDVLVNNAGLMSLAPVAKTLVDEWDRMVDTNIKGVLYGIAAALPVFQRQNSGHFINISSVAGHKVSMGAAVYAGTKFAVRAISEGLRQEVGGSIRTTIISPGAVQSELPMGSSDPETAASVKEMYQQLAIPADSVARAIAFAIEQPADVDINEVLLRPTKQVL